MSEERRHQVVELGRPRATGQVSGHGECGPPAEDVLDIAAQVAPRPHVDEDPQSVPVHGLDRVAKVDPPGPLRDGEPAELAGRFGHAAGRRARVDGHLGGMQLQARVERGERLENGREGRRMVRTGKRKFFADHALRAEVGDDAVNLGGRSREHDLVGTVVDRDHDRLAGYPAGRLGPLAIGPGGDQSGAGDRAFRFQLMEDRGEPDQLPLERMLGPQHARGRKRGQLAAAVAGDRVRTQSQSRQHLEDGPLGREHGGDRGVGGP